jgi:hypothetical protein
LSACELISETSLKSPQPAPVFPEVRFVGGRRDTGKHTLKNPGGRAERVFVLAKLFMIFPMDKN